MKKILFAVAVLISVSLSSCGGFCEKSDNNDTTCVNDTCDTTLVADSTVVADSTLVDVE